MAVQNVPKAHAATVPGQWSITPSNAPANTMLTAVADVNLTDVWATGLSFIGSGYGVIVLEHWNGISWSSSTPFPQQSQASQPRPTAFAVVNSSNIWLTASYNGNGNGSVTRAFIAHWNGLSWQQVQTPDLGLYGSFMESITALSASNIWAYGARGQGGPLIEHWDGTSWSIIAPPPELQFLGYLFGSCATVDGNMWIEGLPYGSSPKGVQLIKTNGTIWDVTDGVSLYNRIACTSPNDIWELPALQSYGGTLGPLNHYNGNTWTYEPADQARGYFQGIAAVNNNDIWVTGEKDSPNYPYQTTLIKHWDGTQLTTVASPSVSGNVNNFLGAASAVNTNDVWAVGYSTDSQNISSALIEHYVGAPSPPTVTNARFTGTAGLPGTGIVYAHSASHVRLTTSRLPPFVQFRDNGDNTGTVIFTPQVGDAGTSVFTVTATDGTRTGIGSVLLTVMKAPSSTPTPTPDPSHQQLFLLISGIRSSTDNARFEKDPNENGGYQMEDPDFGDLEKTIRKQENFKYAYFRMYSYKGSGFSGRPNTYHCEDTLKLSIEDDISNLNTQIKNLLSDDPVFKNRPTDVYLLGHSLGGVIAFGYLAYLNSQSELNGSIKYGVPLPDHPEDHLKGVITLDSPLGGVTSNRVFLQVLVAIYTGLPGCSAVTTLGLFLSIANLMTIFDTAPNSSPQGGQAMLESALFGGQRLTNQDLAQKAGQQGIALLTIGNTHDLTWAPKKACLSLLINEDFLSTQWVKDDKTKGVYGRSFQAGFLPLCIPYLPVIPVNAFGIAITVANHKAVLNDPAVEAGIAQFLNGQDPGLTVEQ